MRPTSPERPHLKTEGPRALCFAERVTLFVAARQRAELPELLAGLAEPGLGRATTYAALVTTWDSARRQARLAHEFAGRPDAAARLRSLLAGAPPTLRAGVVEQLPEALRVTQPLPGAAASPATRSLAARLVREASR